MDKNITHIENDKEFVVSNKKDGGLEIKIIDRFTAIELVFDLHETDKNKLVEFLTKK